MLRQDTLWFRAITPVTHLWERLTEPPGSIIDLRLRQQSRLMSILCISALTGGLAGFTISHYGLMPGRSLPENPIFVVLITTWLLVFLSYFLGRRRPTMTLAAVMLVCITIGGPLAAILINPSDYNTLVIYIVVGHVFASLLLSPWGTRITLVVTFLGLALLPLAAPQISVLSDIHSLGAIFVVSIMVAIGVTMRRRDQLTIEEQARQLAEAKQQAEDANKLKGIFLGMISHELRTPLNNIMGYSDQILMGVTGRVPTATVNAAERIHRNGDQLSRMINDLLMISRLEGGSLAIIPRPFKPADALAQVSQSFRAQAEGKGLSFTTTLDPALPEVIIGDRQRVEQIVLNLVSNALKFTERGEIAVSARRGGPADLVIEVRDTGLGIPPAAVAHIFDRFYQVDSTSKRSHGGAGLGLAIARELAILMGGNIVVHTVVNSGSIFTLTLPLATEDPA